MEEQILTFAAANASCRRQQKLGTERLLQSDCGRSCRPSFAGNYSNDRRFIKTKWLCRCGEKEKEDHITSGNCPIYDDIWEKRGDLENNEDLVKFFSAVLERRDLLDRLEEEERDAPSLGSWDS